jgi:GNAT superfamily N-acetyltransferase
MPYIRPPRQDELETPRSIERDAGRAFAAVGMAEIAADEPPSLVELEMHRANGLAWVAVDSQDRPIAYLLGSIVDGSAHVDQVSVAPAHTRRGLGAALIEHLAAIARAEGRPALTLTAFRDVPWNAPYYQRLGFLIVEPADQGPELAAVVRREFATIPSAAPRVAMRRPRDRTLSRAATAAAAGRTAKPRDPPSERSARHRRRLYLVKEGR